MSLFVISSDLFFLQHIDKVFKHKELQQQLMDAKLQRITEMMKEVEEKQLREREFVRASALLDFYLTFVVVFLRVIMKPWLIARGLKR